MSEIINVAIPIVGIAVLIFVGLRIVAWQEKKEFEHEEKVRRAQHLERLKYQRRINNALRRERKGKK